MGLKCIKANKTLAISPTKAPQVDANSQSNKASYLDDSATENKKGSYLMMDQSLMGETIDREANNETALKG